MKPKDVKGLIEKSGGMVTGMGRIEDSGWATASFPLPKDHWIYGNEKNVPPMPLRMKKDDPRRLAWKQKIMAAGQYAIRTATMNGKEMDFDPDALLQNLVVGFLGYWTKDGLSGESFGNPKPIPPVFE